MRNIRRSLNRTRRQQGWFFLKRTKHEDFEKDMEETKDKIS